MYIMADLSADRSNHVAEIDDHILCSIKIDAHGVIAMTPDFNEGKLPYRIETAHGEMYEYVIEHASQPMSEEERQQEAAIYRG